MVLFSPRVGSKFGLTQITAATVAVVTVSEAKDHFRSTNTKEDTLVSVFIKAATLWAEQFTRRSFMSQKWKLSFDSQPFDVFTIPDTPTVIKLPRPPLITVDSIKFFPDTDVETDFPLSNIIIDTNNIVGRISLKDGKEWPADLRPIDSFHVNYTAGFGTDRDNVPEDIRLAIMRIVSTLSEHREDTVAGVSVNEVTLDAKMILSAYVIPQV